MTDPTPVSLGLVGIGSVVPGRGLSVTPGFDGVSPVIGDFGMGFVFGSPVFGASPVFSGGMSPVGFSDVSPGIGGVCGSFDWPGLVLFIGGLDGWVPSVGFGAWLPVVVLSPGIGSPEVDSFGFGSPGFGGCPGSFGCSACRSNRFFSTSSGDAFSRGGCDF